MTARHLRPATLCGLVLTLGIGSLPFPVWLDQFADPRSLLAVELAYWALAIATVLHVRAVERRPLASIGLRRPTWRGVALAVATAAITVAGLAAIVLAVFPALGLDEGEQITRLREAPVWWLSISVVRAGVSEELLFRGYPIERLYEATGSRVLAAGLPWCLFTLAHVGPWSWAHVLVAGFGGAMFTALYLWRRDLTTTIVAHVLVDAVAVFA